MKKLVITLCLIIAITVTGCSMLGLGPKPANETNNTNNNAAGPKYDAKTMLKAYVMANIKMVYVDPAKAKIGQMATRDMGTMTQTVAVVGEWEGKKLVELTGSMMKDYVSGKLAVVTMAVEENGDVVKAFGGLVGTEGVELEVPEKKEPPKAAPVKGEKPKTEDLGEKDMFGFKAKGTKVMMGANTSETWMCKDFPFFGGLMKSVSGPSKIEIKEYKAEGAKAQLKLPGAKKEEKKLNN